ncbi:hypothetical protein SDC9_138312 [bioreactor metagenome]|uniref:Type 4 fimbrial biogenesis protein PilX N-terminal domain-containing protein n=1 Tax=bioreactor metagenome TaxID=1076179 RepID=A0A645DPK2_9ZZZZ|nr:hypothetical protein [Christensenella sp.]
MKQYPSRMGVGASSILLILVVVSLTLFASLALMQARSDAALTDKTAVSASAYYDADARAQQMLAALDDALKQGYAPESVEGVTRQEDGSYRFSVGSCDGHALNVAVDLGGGSCNVLSYRYESAAEWVGQDAGTLWQGG